LWYDRASSQIRAEDYAELLAAKWERGMVFQDEQSAPYDWNAGTVSLRVVKSKIEATVDGLVDCILPDDAFVGGTWLDTENALPSDGGTAVVYAAAEWYVMTTNQPGPGKWWKMTGNDDALCHAFRTLNTRAVEFNPGIHVPGHTNSFVPVTELGRHSGQTGIGLAADNNSYFWGGQGAWWTYAGLGTNVFVLPHDVIYPIRTNVLSHARTLAKSMTRSARWYSTLHECATNIISCVSYGSAVSSTSRTDNVQSPSESEYRALVTGIAENESGINVYTNYFNEELGYIDIRSRMREWHEDDAHVPTPEHFYDVWVDCFFRRTTISDIVPEYPSPQMIASGMVDRVRIYLIVTRDPYNVSWPIGSGFIDNGMVVVPEDYGDTLLMDWQLDATKPNSYVADDLGTGYILCAIPEMLEGIASLGYNSQYDTYANLCSGRVYPNTIIVNLVYDSGENGPVTNRPSFNVAADFYLPDIAMKQMMMEDLTHGAKGLPADRWYEKNELRQYKHSIVIFGVMIVVDWNFQHMTDTPYQPTPHTPEWLSTNAP
jgi:hypothetical protein